MRFISRTPIRTFLLYPLHYIALGVNHPRRSDRDQSLVLAADDLGLLCSTASAVDIAAVRGGGGPGPEVPPDRLVCYRVIRLYA